MVRNPPVVQETQVQFLVGEDPLETGMATFSSILAWRTPWTEEPSNLYSMGLQRVGHDWVTNTFSLVIIVSSLNYKLHEAETLTLLLIKTLVGLQKLSI